MEPLPNGYMNVAIRVEFARKWFTGRKADFDAEVTRIKNEIQASGLLFLIQASGLLFLYPFGFIAGGCGVLFALSEFLKGSGFLGVAWSLVAVAGLLFLIAGAVADNRETEKLVALKQQEWDDDPLRRRAELILRAAQAFHIHCRGYEALYERVRDDVQNEDKDASDRYLKFLARHYAGIGRATDNFRRVVETMDYVAAQQKKYPELVAKGDDATPLAALMEQLNEPVETLPVFGVDLDPLAALEHEELLEHIARDADPLKNLDARISAALGGSEQQKADV